MSRSKGKSPARDPKRRSVERPENAAKRQDRLTFEAMTARHFRLTEVVWQRLHRMQPFRAALHNKLAPHRCVAILTDTLMDADVVPLRMWEFMHMWADHYGHKTQESVMEQCYDQARERRRQREAQGKKRRQAGNDDRSRQQAFEARKVPGGRPESNRRKF